MPKLLRPSRRRFLQALAASVTVATLTCPAVEPPPAARLHAAATTAVANAKLTRYEHNTDIAADAGRYICDCSGLVVYLLRATLPQHLKAVPKDAGKPRALAWNFHALATALPTSGEPGPDGWALVERLEDTRAGDILVWRHNNPKPGSSGHVMIVDRAPEKEGRQYRVTIIDSGCSPHDRDTRPADTSGIGRGDVFLTVDQDGRPNAWRWSKPNGQINNESILILRPVTN
ncbi:MAG TPA: hypothetical protein PLA50_13185 [Bacteroidia bacterium]|nr:hypothetical protein [Bacteroidia bacterium]